MSNLFSIPRWVHQGGPSRIYASSWITNDGSSMNIVAVSVVRKPPKPKFSCVLWQVFFVWYISVVHVIWDNNIVWSIYHWCRYRRHRGMCPPPPPPSSGGKIEREKKRCKGEDKKRRLLDHFPHPPSNQQSCKFDFRFFRVRPRCRGHTTVPSKAAVPRSHSHNGWIHVTQLWQRNTWNGVELLVISIRAIYSETCL